MIEDLPKCVCTMEQRRYRFGPCSKCQPIEHKTRQENAERLRYEARVRDEIEAIYTQIERLQAGSLLPERSLEQSFENYNAVTNEQRQALDQCRKYAKLISESAGQGRWLCLVGNCGTGKGHLSASIAREVIHRYLMPVKYVKLIELVASIKSAWRRGVEKTDEDILAEFRECPGLLILDEIGVQFGSDTERMYLYRVMDYRYEHLLATVLTTNLTLDQLKAMVGVPVFDRMREEPNEMIFFGWPSYRVRTKDNRGGVMWAN